MTEQRLREMRLSDLHILYEHNRDAEARHMAAFAPPDPDDKTMFLAHMEGMRINEDIIKRTIEVDGEVAGNIICFEVDGKPTVGYWLGREFWGRGIATQALRDFLLLIDKRPVVARVVKDNISSRRVLEKCGFEIVGEDESFAHGRGEMVEEYILQLGE